MTKPLNLCSLVAAVCITASFGIAQKPVALVLVQNAPKHGIIMARVDLSQILQMRKIRNFSPKNLQALLDNGRSVPLQFVPDEYHPLKGTLLMQLPNGGDWQVQLIYKPTKPSMQEQWDGTVITPQLIVKHDATHMGGLPSQIQFSETGKTFVTFVWNDRVHHRKLGSFHLRNDKKPKMQVVSDGEIATVVRVKAKYCQADGKQPTSQPEATYEWFYFRAHLSAPLQILPLIFVTANVRQRELFSWNELHFLELNFPDESFRQWAGGEPLQKGEFVASQKSFGFSEWGALIDGNNIIAVLRSGRALFHDGRGGYGTYLHAHGDVAWQEWKTTERNFSAWLLLGSFDDPIAVVRSMLHQLPTDAKVVVTLPEIRKAIARANGNVPAWYLILAEKLEAKGRFSDALQFARGKAPTNWLFESIGDLGIAFERTADGIRLQSLFDLALVRSPIRSDSKAAPKGNGATPHPVRYHEQGELLAENPLPLFTLTLRHLPTKREIELHADSGWQKVGWRKIGDGILLYWERPKEVGANILVSLRGSFEMPQKRSSSPIKVGAQKFNQRLQTETRNTNPSRKGVGNIHAAGFSQRLTIRQLSTKFIGQPLAQSENPSDSQILWSLNITQLPNDWSLLRVSFPQIAVADLGENAEVFFPRGPGEVQRNLWRRAFTYRSLYPNGWCTMQFVAAYSEAQDKRHMTGIYVGVHDPNGSAKETVVKSEPDVKRVILAFEHPVPNIGIGGNEFKQSGKVVWQILRGDWFDAAMIYRDWAQKEAKWSPKLVIPKGEIFIWGRFFPISLIWREGIRIDTPQWMKELCIWAVGGGAPKDCVPIVKEFAEFMGMPVGFHWYNWHQIPFDNDYPHYFPAKEDFYKGVRELQQSNVFVMPYINGRLWDTRDKGLEDWQFSKVALPAATKQEDGTPYTESYGSKESDGSDVKLAPMCPTTKLWQEKVREIVLKLFNEFGVNAVYIDQVAAAAPALCFDKTHGHPIGGGSWWNEGYWQMLSAIRDDIRIYAREVKTTGETPMPRALTTECNAEPFLSWFDGYLTWHWQHNGQVPAFPAVYGGAIQMFGRAYRGGATKDLALRMKAGQQLVFGEQIGWIDPNIVREKDNAEFLRQVARLRWHLRRYFYAGEMARPPKLVSEGELQSKSKSTVSAGVSHLKVTCGAQLVGKIPKVRADWQWAGEWWVETDAILTGAWKLPRENKLVLIFINVGDQHLRATLVFDGKGYGLTGKQLQVKEITEQGSNLVGDFPLEFRKTINFPAKTALALEFDCKE
ncbi:MAG: DUF6259 domain-containing protein [Armatimonadetes bacterium]|nr:DUF6259 domain-containing protein [Armatimonadota bacterium]